MSGFFPHLFAGFVSSVIGLYYFKNYFYGRKKNKEKILLVIICLFFSIIPDIFLIIYYLTNIYPKDFFFPFHNIVHFIIGPAAIISLLVLKYKTNVKRRPIWIMGFWSLLLHLSLDIFITEYSLWF